MVYAIIAGGVFLSDLILKRYMDKKYARKVRHPRLGGRMSWKNIITKARPLNFMVKKPKLSAHHPHRHSCRCRDFFLFSDAS